jgi:hypothetical protein
MRDTPGLVATCAALLASLAGGAMGATPVTYVATWGVDKDSCPIVQPCRSFAGALAQTSEGGEIVVLDAGGYGPVQIRKSVTIVAPEGIYAGISVFTGIGVDIGPPAARVKLSGLTIVGLVDSVSVGVTGVAVSAAAHVSIERTVIGGFGYGGYAVTLCCQPGELRLADTTMHSNTLGVYATSPWSIVIERGRFVGSGLIGNGGTRATIVDSQFTFGAGVALGPNIASGGTPGGSIWRSVFSDGSGVVASGWSSEPINVSLARSVFVRNGIGLDIDIGLNAGAPAAIDVDRCVFADNGSFGIRNRSSHPLAKLTLSGNTITREATGVAHPAGTSIESRGDNTFRNNGADVAGDPLTPIPGL